VLTAMVDRIRASSLFAPRHLHGADRLASRAFMSLPRKLCGQHSMYRLARVSELEDIEQRFKSREELVRVLELKGAILRGTWNRQG
jgi:hypothetical protein